MLTEMAKRRQTEQPIAPAGPSDPVSNGGAGAVKTLPPTVGKRPADGVALARELMLCLNPRAWDLVNDVKAAGKVFCAAASTVGVVSGEFADLCFGWGGEPLVQHAVLFSDSYWR